MGGIRGVYGVYITRCGGRPVWCLSGGRNRLCAGVSAECLRVYPGGSRGVPGGVPGGPGKFPAGPPGPPGPPGRGARGARGNSGNSGGPGGCRGVSRGLGEHYTPSPAEKISDAEIFSGEKKFFRREKKFFGEKKNFFVVKKKFSSRKKIFSSEKKIFFPAGQEKIFFSPRGTLSARQPRRAYGNCGPLWWLEVQQIVSPSVGETIWCRPEPG